MRLTRGGGRSRGTCRERSFKQAADSLSWAKRALMDEFLEDSQPDTWSRTPIRTASPLTSLPVPSLPPPSLSVTSTTSHRISSDSSFENVVPKPPEHQPPAGMAHHLDGDPESPSREPWAGPSANVNPFTSPSALAQVVRTVGPFPTPGTIGAPCFNGLNVTSFLETFELACKSHYISTPDRVSMLPHYCDAARKMEVETLPEIADGSWEGITKAMKKLYKSTDVSQTMMTLAYLESISQYREAPSHDELYKYANEFRAISKKLLDKQIVSNPVRCRLFLRRFPEKMQWSICRATDIDIEDPESLKWDDVFHRAEKEIRAMKNYQALKNKDSSNPEVAQLVEDMATQRSGVKGLSLNVPIIQTGALGAPGNMRLDKPQMSKQVDDLVEKFNAMTLPIMTSMAESQKMIADSYVRMIRTGQPFNVGPARQNQLPNVPAIEPAGPSPFSSQEVRHVSAAYGSTPRAPLVGPRDCYHCKGSGHMRGSCPTAMQQIAEGKCHIREGRLYMGTADRPIPWLSIYPRRDPSYTMAADVEALWAQYISEDRVATAAPASSSAKVSMIQVYEPGDDESDESSFPGMATYSVSTDPRKADTFRKAQRERVFPTVKVPPPMGKASAPVPGRDTMDLDLDEPAKLSSSWQGPNREKLEQVLKEKGNSVRLLNKILETPLQLSLGDVLSNSSELRSALFKGIPKGSQNGAFHVRSAAIQDEREKVQHTMDRIRDLRSSGCPYLKVKVNGEPVDALWDTGAEVSVISEQWAEALQLPVSHNVRINMKGIGGSNENVNGCAEDVSIHFGHLEYPTSLFVVQGIDPDTFVLGRPLQRATRAKMSDARSESRHPVFEFTSLDGREKVSMTASGRVANREFSRRDCYQSSSLKA